MRSFWWFFEFCKEKISQTFLLKPDSLLSKFISHSLFVVSLRHFCVIFHCTHLGWTQREWHGDARPSATRLTVRCQWKRTPTPIGGHPCISLCQNVGFWKELSELNRWLLHGSERGGWHICGFASSEPLTVCRRGVDGDKQLHSEGNGQAGVGAQRPGGGSLSTRTQHPKTITVDPSFFSRRDLDFDQKGSRVIRFISLDHPPGEGAHSSENATFGVWV